MPANQAQSVAAVRPAPPQEPCRHDAGTGSRPPFGVSRLGTYTPETRAPADGSSRVLWPAAPSACCFFQLSRFGSLPLSGVHLEGGAAYGLGERWVGVCRGEGHQNLHGARVADGTDLVEERRHGGLYR